MSDASIGPVFLVTDRLDELARFYDRFPLRSTSREPEHHVWYECDGPDLVLHVPRREPGANFMPVSRGALIWFGVTEGELTDLAAVWRAEGVRSWGPFEGGARTLLYALDPDGNGIGVYASTD